MGGFIFGVDAWVEWRASPLFGGAGRAALPRVPGSQTRGKVKAGGGNCWLVYVVNITNLTMPALSSVEIELEHRSLRGAVGLEGAGFVWRPLTLHWLMQP